MGGKGRKGVDREGKRRRRGGKGEVKGGKGVGEGREGEGKEGKGRRKKREREKGRDVPNPSSPILSFPHFHPLRASDKIHQAIS